MEMLFNFLREGKRYIVGSSIVFLCGVGILIPYPVLFANEMGLSLTIAPPLFQLNLQPGETWSSTITVVNNNDYDVTLFTEAVRFEPADESGRPGFILPQAGVDEVMEQSSTLAGWLIVPQGALPVLREQTYRLPVTIRVPEDASPGGHYAAVLIGNRANERDPVEGGTVSVTSSLAALFFLSVAGDVVEQGRVRDFVTEKSIYERPEASLSLRFENQGNVHLLPQGSITIYNMFGKVRGTIPINQQKDYGNVLPNSVRKFSFMWESEASMWDIGRYRAEVTIGYGKEQKQSALATTYFYVLPIVPLLEIIGGLLALVLFAGWILRLYIRRALALETAHLQVHDRAHTAYAPEGTHTVTASPRIKLGTLVQPIRAGLVDLRQVGAPVAKVVEPDVQAVYMPHRRQQVKALTLGTFLRKYWLFFVSVVVLALGGFALSIFFEDVMTVSRDYTFSEVRTDATGTELPVE